MTDLGASPWKRIIAESVAIVASILLALAADAAWQARANREMEEGALRDISESLTNDIDAIATRLARLQAIESSVLALREHVAEGRPYTPALDTLFGQFYVAGGVQLNRAAYEGLKASGLSLVRDDRLRLALIRVYDTDFPRLERSNDLINSGVIEEMRPYMLRNFRNLRAGQTATPLDYAGLVRDPFLLNLIDYRLAVLENTGIPTHTAVLASATELRTDLLAALEEP